MKKVILLVTTVALLVISCGSDPSSHYTYRQPEETDDGLDVGTLDKVNMDQALIESAVDDISGGKYGEIHSSGKELPAFWAYGFGGQRIVVFTEQNAVVVFTGGNYSSADTTAKILTGYVIPAFE